jgi:hypothetical protein
VVFFGYSGFPRQITEILLKVALNTIILTLYTIPMIVYKIRQMARLTKPPYSIPPLNADKQIIKS